MRDLSGKTQERFAIIGELARKHQRQKAVLDDPRVLGNAADLVKTESGLQQTIDQLLGSYLVVSEMDDALNLSGRSPRMQSFVTLNGDVLLNNGMALLGKNEWRWQNQLFSCYEILAAGIGRNRSGAEASA